VNEPLYHINLFWSAEDDCWIADVPDLRPCSAHGDTRKEALAHCYDAIEGWLAVARDNGMDIPEPRSIAPRSMQRRDHGTSHL
jgi:predicted RNase H-like HicB family nuclease